MHACMHQTHREEVAERGRRLAEEVRDGVGCRQGGHGLSVLAGGRADLHDWGAHIERRPLHHHLPAGWVQSGAASAQVRALCGCASWPLPQAALQPVGAVP